MSRPRVYFLLQAAAFATWWVVLLVAPAARGAFVAPGASFSSLAAFALGDLAVVALTVPVLNAARRGRAFATTGAWLIAGAVGYAALYCLGLFALTGGAALAAVVMVPAAAGSAWAARELAREVAV